MTNTIKYDAETLARLAAGVEIINPKGGLKEKLALAEKEKRPLRVKLGADPTAPDLHLGHAVVLKKLKQFQDAGHQIVFIIGDGTTLIGDPSGRNSTRPPLTPDEIKQNAETYFGQVGKVLDLAKTEVRYNAEWLGKLGFADMIKLAGQATVAQLLTREDFANRMRDEVPVSLHELLYPLVQAYDSVAIKADIEFGGTDQLFNNMMGRHLQERMGQPGQIVMCMHLLRGLDGTDKMSKSKHNYIGITEAPEAMYGKAMSIPDALLEEWATLTTDWHDNERKSALALIAENPMEAKKLIAHNITTQYCGVAGAEAGAQHFYQNVQNRDVLSKDYETKTLANLGVTVDGLTLLSLCKALAPDQSNGELRRLIQGGGVALDGEKASDSAQPVHPPVKLKLGKRGFYEVTE